MFKKAVILISTLLLFFAISLTWLIHKDFFFWKSRLNGFLSSQVILNTPISKKSAVDVIYILGGSQESLEFKFLVAADFFSRGMCERVWFYSNPMKTEYDSALGRNLTTDEWSIKELTKLGIAKEHIESITIKKGFWGTFSEAETISSLIKKRGYKRIILVTAPYHTQRVKLSFEYFMKNNHNSMQIFSSNEKVLLLALLQEYVKLKLYEFLLIDDDLVSNPRN